jgi:ABC-2 type transport system ATP-binding protein
MLVATLQSTPTTTLTSDHAPEPGIVPGEPIIDIQGLVKRYGSLTAVDNVDLAVYPREIFGILGPNGAGKTTTLEMIEGLRAPDAGTIRVAGLDPVRQAVEVHRLIGVQLQTTALFDFLSSAELIALFANLYGADGSTARVNELLALVGLEEKAAALVNQLSGGQRQRLALAIALVNAPLVAFLDEPTTGLDPSARRGVWRTIRGIREAGTTVVLTTHYMEEAEVLCDRVAIMDQGRVIECDTPSSLVRQLGAATTIRAQLAGGSLAAAELDELAGVVEASQETLDGLPTLFLRSNDAQATLIDLLDLAQRRGVTLSGLNTAQADLEDVFLARTGRRFDRDDGSPPEPEPAPKRRRFGRQPSSATGNHG